MRGCLLRLPIGAESSLHAISRMQFETYNSTRVTMAPVDITMIVLVEKPANIASMPKGSGSINSPSVSIFNSAVAS